MGLIFAAKDDQGTRFKAISCLFYAFSSRYAAAHHEFSEAMELLEITDARDEQLEGRRCCTRVFRVTPRLSQAKGRPDPGRGPRGRWVRTRLQLKHGSEVIRMLLSSSFRCTEILAQCHQPLARGGQISCC